MVDVTPSTPSPASGRRSQTLLWLVVVVVVAAGCFVLGRFAFPAAASSQPAPASAGGHDTPHGWSKITQGVPSGYSHDPSGAANAAVNLIQLLSNAAHGQADPATIAATWTSAAADNDVRRALSAPVATTGDDQTNKVPAATRITAYADTAATVEVWIVAAGSSAGTAGGTVTAARWSTQTVQLNWENGDWKVASLRTAAGPQPGQTTTSSTAPLTNGFYTVYIN